MKRLLPVAVVVTLLMPATLSAQRQEILQLSADIINLEQRVIAIQRSLDERNSVVQDLVEQMSDQVSMLGEAVARITTTLDQVQTGNERLGGELRVAIGNLQDDLDVMDRTLGDVRGQVSALSQQMTALSASTEQLNSPDALFREAQADKLAGYYELAIESFEDFIQAYPSSPRVPDARYELGAAYHAMGQFDRAIIELDFLLQMFPESAKTVDALYTKGLALASSGQTSEARSVFQQLVSDYPDSAQAELARQRIDELGN